MTARPWLPTSQTVLCTFIRGKRGCVRTLQEGESRTMPFPSQLRSHDSRHGLSTQLHRRSLASRFRQYDAHPHEHLDLNPSPLLQQCLIDASHPHQPRRRRQPPSNPPHALRSPRPLQYSRGSRPSTTRLQRCRHLLLAAFLHRSTERLPPGHLRSRRKRRDHRG